VNADIGALAARAPVRPLAGACKMQFRPLPASGDARAAFALDLATPTATI
jgi:hypothetical protein